MKRLQDRWATRALLVSILMVSFVATAHNFDQRDREPAPVERLQLYVVGTGSDVVGRALVNDLRQAIASSKQYALARTEQEAVLVVHVVTVEAACTPTNSSAAAVALVTNSRAQTLLDLRSLTMSATMTREMAGRTLIDWDKPIADWRRSIQ